MVGRSAVLVSQTSAARFGLVRAWYAQVGSQRATGSIMHVNLDHDMLLVQASSGMITSLDAETGRTLWATQVGPPNHLSTEPAANGKFVVVVKGSVIYVLDRVDGRIVWQKQLGGAPGSGPGVSQTHAFVPMITGLIEGYNLDKGAKQTPWVYKSAGRVLIPPVTTRQSVSWTTEKGYFYVADPSGGGIRYRLETRGAIQARPGYWTPDLFACSTDGFVYAVNESQGKIDWKFGLGDAVYNSPVAVEGKVFVISEVNGLYCLDGKAGRQDWYAPKISQFVSVSPTRVYGCDSLGRLAVLDARTGARLGTMPLDGITIKVINEQSDRVFLASDTCVMQCLREADLKSPVVYTPPAPLKIESTKLKPAGDVAGDKPAAPKKKPAAKADSEEPAMEGDKPEEPAADGDVFK
jgi:outer membrane protein assembly factor BamB